MISNRTATFFALLVVIAMVAAACGSEGETSPVETAVPGVDVGADATTTTTMPPEAADEPPTDDYGDPEAHEPTDDHHGEDDHGDDNHGDAGTPIDGVDDAPEIGTVVEAGTATPPGTYVVSVLGEDWRLTTSEPLFVQNSNTNLMVAQAEAWGPGGPNVMFLTRAVGIVPPREAGVHQDHHPVVPEATVDLPDSLETWFEAVPQVEVIDRGTATVAGSPASWWQVAVDPTAGDTFHCPLGEHCIGWAVHDQMGVWVLSANRHFTVWQLEAIPDIIGWVETVDEAAGAVGRDAMAALLAGLTAA